jgi:Zn-dependent protease
MDRKPPSTPKLHLFGTPLVTRGWLSLPFNELGAWLVMTWLARRKHPARTLLRSLGVGFLSMIALLKWEWLHNIAHAVAARWAGKPMDSLEIIAGMPICVYSPENHRSATPRQHVQRALGGPLFNLAAMVVTRLLRRASPPEGLQRELLDVAVAMNTFLCTASFLPIPGIDGGPILKWSLVASGRPPQQADYAVRRANLAFSPFMGILAGAHFWRRRWLSGGLAVFFAVAGFAVGMGWMRGESRET